MAWWGKNKKQPSRRQPSYMTGQDKGAFRRSRTLSGRKPTEQQKRQSVRLEEHARQRKNHILRLTAVVLVISIAVIYWLASQYVISISSVSFLPQTSSTPPQEPYRKAISDYLNKYPVERFRFILNKDRLSDFVGKRQPEVQSVKSSGGGIGHGGYEVTLRQPLVGWRIGAKQYLVDSKGVAFNRNYFNQPTVSVIDESGVRVGESGIIASNRFLGFLGRIVSLADQSGVGQVERIVIPPDVLRQVNIYLKDKPYFIKTNVDRDPAQQIEDIKKVATFLNDRSITPQYIDVRVSGRAFYR